MRDPRQRSAALPLRILALMATASALIVTSSPAQAQSPRWIWTLYDDSNPVVLALEIPDTPRLKTTLECEASSALVRISLYENEALPEGPAIISSGGHQSPAQIESRGTRRVVTLQADHPVFNAFQADGRLEIAASDQTAAISLGSANLSKLNRFARACAT